MRLYQRCLHQYKDRLYNELLLYPVHILYLLQHRNSKVLGVLGIHFWANRMDVDLDRVRYILVQYRTMVFRLCIFPWLHYSSSYGWSPLVSCCICKSHKELICYLLGGMDLCIMQQGISRHQSWNLQLDRLSFHQNSKLAPKHCSNADNEAFSQFASPQESLR